MGFNFKRKGLPCLFSILVLAGLAVGFTYAIKAFRSNASSSTSGKKRNDYTITYKSVIKNNPYRLHIAEGKKRVSTPYKNSSELRKASHKSKVKRISNSTGFIVDDLSHSEPYLHPDAAKILFEIGKRFAEKSDGHKFIITSLTRTIENQTKLTKSNINASPNTSSHSYAVSFDLAYSKFNRNREYNHNAHKALEETLIKLQKEKRIYVLREKQSACYHVTVR